MSEWWSQQDAALLGAMGGSAVGILGALLGTLVGYFAPRGRHKGIIIPFHITLVVVGLGVLSAGVVAIAVKQPYHVWYPLALGGFIMSVVLGSLLPVVVRRFAQAEMRRIDAEQIRRG